MLSALWEPSPTAPEAKGKPDGKGDGRNACENLPGVDDRRGSVERPPFKEWDPRNPLPESQGDAEAKDREESGEDLRVSSSKGHRAFALEIVDRVVAPPNGPALSCRPPV